MPRTTWYIKISSKWLLLFFAVAAAACNNPQPLPAHPQQKDTVNKAAAAMAVDLNGKFSDQTALVFDSTLLTGFFKTYPLLVPFKDGINLFYTKRNFSFAWYDNRGLIEPAGNFYARVQNLPAEGISVTLPYLQNLDSLMANGDITVKKQQAETELLLTGLYFYFAKRVWGGLDENTSTKMEWYLPRKKIPYEKWLDSLLKKPGGFTGAREPVYRQYGLLKAYLEKYRQLEKAGQWRPIPPGALKSYRLHDSSTVIRQVKIKLGMTGDLTVADTGYLFNRALQDAVGNFQHRYGLKEDSIIGQQLIKELNAPLRSKIEKILVNMERSRWLPMAVNGEYLAVNIPEFRLHMYDNDSLLWSMNVVVGKAVSRTVIFSGYLKYIVFSPYWNVPASIYTSEVLPGIQKNKRYLALHHMEKTGNGVRQIPGPWNSLGQVKFLFPNSYSIYLHDTPAKSLFGESKRDFSHGCIRLAEPKKLAAYLLRNNASWNDEKIGAAMKKGKEQYVTLAKPVPVFITYFTAWVDRNGQLNLRDDIYNRDKRLVDMMMSKQ